MDCEYVAGPNRNYDILQMHAGGGPNTSSRLKCNVAQVQPYPFQEQSADTSTVVLLNGFGVEDCRKAKRKLSWCWDKYW